MTTEVDFKTIDRRLTARKLRKGFLSEREVEKDLKSLKDVAGEGVATEVTLEPVGGSGQPRSR
jgi:hypothetical protein